MIPDTALRLAFGAMAPATVDAMIRRFSTPDDAVEAIVRGRTRVSAGTRSAVAVPAEQRRRELEAAGIDVDFVGGPTYPCRLDLRDDRPRWLFRLGERLAGGPSVAIVGTRTCTTYGTGLAASYGHAASELGWTVVSGLARGIDAAAHEGALDGRGRCVAVLGSGVDVVYPKGNRHVYERLRAAGGVLLSEYPPGTPPEGWRFPTRNRIIAGLADAVVVVEAGERGGALITADIALRYGISVFATPGDIDRVASIGTNRLIRDGAFPVLGPDDLAASLTLLASIAAT